MAAEGACVVGKCLHWLPSLAAVDIPLFIPAQLGLAGSTRAGPTGVELCSSKL